VNKPQVYDALPVRHQTYSYLPSSRTSLFSDWYRIILFCYRGSYEQLAKGRYL